MATFDNPMNRLSHSTATEDGGQGITVSEARNGRHPLAPSHGAPIMCQSLLLVEDSIPMREVIGQILGDHFGSIHWVADGAKVLTEAARVMPDTIILDISLPGMSGLILLPLLRRAHPHTTIVMLTNHSDDFYRGQAFDRGADAYVLKSQANLDLIPAILARSRDQHRDRVHQEQSPPDVLGSQLTADDLSR